MQPWWLLILPYQIIVTLKVPPDLSLISEQEKERQRFLDNLLGYSLRDYQSTMYNKCYTSMIAILPQKAHMHH